MVNYKLSPKASEDFAELYEYGIEKFGLLQAQKYSNHMHQVFEFLMNRRELWIQAFYIKPGLYRYRYQSHIIFFFIEESKIYVVRILEQHRDFKRHL